MIAEAKAARLVSIDLPNYFNQSAQQSIKANAERLQELFPEHKIHVRAGVSDQSAKSDPGFAVFLELFIDGHVFDYISMPPDAVGTTYESRASAVAFRFSDLVDKAINTLGSMTDPFQEHDDDEEPCEKCGKWTYESDLEEVGIDMLCPKCAEEKREALGHYDD